jgi:hypothetical protein
MACRIVVLFPGTLNRESNDTQAIVKMNRALVNRIDINELMWMEFYSDGTVILYSRTAKVITGIEMTKDEAQAVIEGLVSASDYKNTPLKECL